MNMTTFTDKQLKVMANENSPRGLAARAELLRRKDQAGTKGLAQDESKQEVSVGTQSEEPVADKPKRNTRRKRNNKQEETE